MDPGVDSTSWADVRHKFNLQSVTLSPFPYQQPPLEEERGHTYSTPTDTPTGPRSDLVSSNISLSPVTSPPSSLTLSSTQWNPPVASLESGHQRKIKCYVKKWKPSVRDSTSEAAPMPVINLAAVNSGDVRDWCRIADQLPGRTNKDCRKRWHNSVAGGLKKGQWSKSEDQLLIMGVEQYGQKWTLVATCVTSRSADRE